MSLSSTIDAARKETDQAAGSPKEASKAEGRDSKTQRQRNTPSKSSKSVRQKDKTNPIPIPAFKRGETGNLELQFHTQVQSQDFCLTREIINSSATKLLWPLIRPLCALANAAVHQRMQTLRSPGKEYERTATGKLDKNSPRLDPDGKPVYLPSPLEIARMAYQDLMKDPQVYKLLIALNERLEVLQNPGQGNGDGDGDSPPPAEPSNTGPAM